MSWTHLARISHKGAPTWAQLVDPSKDGSLAETIKVNIATGSPIKRTIKLTGEIVSVATKDLLAPVEDPPIVVQVGLNYPDHVNEAEPMGYKNLTPPTPFIFWRPSSCIADPYAEITVYPIQQDCLDYEGELVVIAGYEPFKDLSVEEAKKQIIGYSVGNDFSPRPGPKLGAMNYIWSKSFDKFTPVGPILVSAAVLGTPPSIELTTRLDGKVVQNDNTKNMTHSVAKIVSALSIGTTVQPGTVIFSGTCGGGQWFIDGGKSGGIPSGSKVEVEIEGIGKIVTVPIYQ